MKSIRRGWSAGISQIGHDETAVATFNDESEVNAIHAHMSMCIRQQVSQLDKSRQFLWREIHVSKIVKEAQGGEMERGGGEILLLSARAVSVCVQVMHDGTGIVWAVGNQRGDSFLPEFKGNS